MTRPSGAGGKGCWGQEGGWDQAEPELGQRWRDGERPGPEPGGQEGVQRQEGVPGSGRGPACPSEAVIKGSRRPRGMMYVRLN